MDFFSSPLRQRALNNQTNQQQPGQEQRQRALKHLFNREERFGSAQLWVLVSVSAGKERLSGLQFPLLAKSPLASGALGGSGGAAGEAAGTGAPSQPRMCWGAPGQPLPLRRTRGQHSLLPICLNLADRIQDAEAGCTYSCCSQVSFSCSSYPVS